MSALRLVSTLEEVPVGRLHGVEDTIDELGGDLLVEQVAHGIDEDHARPLPRKWLGQPAPDAR